MSHLGHDTLEDLQRFGRVASVNVLLIGQMPLSDRNAVLRTVRRQRGLDVFHAQRSAEFVLPDRDDVILVLDDVSQLSRDHQVRLLEWMSRNQVQIVSFASRSLYDMVCGQKFIDRLYYHLNTVCVIGADS